MKIGMRFLCVVLVCTFITPVVTADSAAVEVSARSAILLEAETGEVLFEQNPDEQLPIASVTKVMTMLLIMEALQSGKITMDEMVTASDYACSMGGSQIYLKPGEQMSVHDMLKAIAVASANDAAVAMGEHIMGSEQAFIEAMNTRAKSLGMENTHFVNCNGLDEDNHYSSARDVGIMSKELLKHPEIRPFLSIWMDTLRNGEFGLSNTNKLIRFYKGAIGIKTGSTGKAKYCLSAAATRNDLTLIAVVLAAESTQERFSSATKLLDYGFANYEIAEGVRGGDPVAVLPVTKGVEPQVNVVAKEDFKKLLSKGKKGAIEQQIVLPERVDAPVRQGDKMGDLVFTMDGQQIGMVDLVAQQEVSHINVGGVLWGLVKQWTMVR